MKDQYGERIAWLEEVLDGYRTLQKYRVPLRGLLEFLEDEGVLSDSDELDECVLGISAGPGGTVYLELPGLSARWNPKRGRWIAVEE